MAKPVRTGKSRNLSQAGPDEPVLVNDEIEFLGMSELEWKQETHGSWDEFKESRKPENMPGLEESIPPGDGLEEMVPFDKEAFEKAAVILKEFSEANRQQQLQSKSNARLYELGRIHANVMTIMAKNHPTPMTELYFQGFDDKIAEILASSKRETLPTDNTAKNAEAFYTQEQIDEMLNKAETIEEK